MPRTPRVLAIVVTERAAKGVTIRCDRCGTDRQVPPGETVEDLVLTLRLQGWLIRDGVDCCSTCRPGA